MTLSKNRPFAFLDHALRSGDSLAGLSDIQQLEQFALREEDSIRSTLFGNMTQIISNVISAARMRRTQLERRPSNTAADIEAKATMFEQVQRQTVRLKYLADVILAAYWEGGRQNQLQARLHTAFHEHFDRFCDGDPDDQAAAAREVRVKAGCPTLFHWPIEFPEVFDRGDGRPSGFDAIVGNPPFLGNRLWKSLIGDHMQWQAEMILGRSPGKIDLCVIFHRRVVELIRDGGGYGLLATTNIAEGTAIPIGLGEICTNGEIIFAIKVFKWPGKASVTAAVVCFLKGRYEGIRCLDGREVDYIGPRLESQSASSWEPMPVSEPLFSFAGVDNSKGLAFVLSADDPWFDRLRSEPGSLLRQYITGNDITSYALNKVERWALDIGDRDLDDIEAAHPVAYRFLMDVVKPTRTPTALKSYKGLVDRWWQFWNHRADLIREVRTHPTCVVFGKVTKHPICMTASSFWIFTNQVVVVRSDRDDVFPICLSTFFTEWLVQQQGAKFGVGASLRLSVRDAFDTFPLPTDAIAKQGVSAAKEYEQLARTWCRAHTCGLTQFADALGNPSCNESEIVKARELIALIDAEVAQAYSMDDWEMARDFRIAHYIVGESTAFIVSEASRAEIIDFLTKLNRELYQQTVPNSRRGDDE